MNEKRGVFMSMGTEGWMVGAWGGIAFMAFQARKHACI